MEREVVPFPIGGLAEDSSPDTSADYLVTLDATDSTPKKVLPDNLGFEPSDGDLTAIAALTGTGIAARTGSDSWSLRTVTGTTGETSVANGDGSGGNPTIGLADDAVMPGTGGFVPPSGTTAQRPGAPTDGTTRWNTTNGELEHWDGSSWGPIGGSSTFADDVFRVQDNGDATKELAFEVSPITTGTTRTITVDDRNIDLSANATFAEAAHAGRHETGGADEIDGDKIDIDWNPTNYTPSTTPTEADSVDNLTAHLYGIDQELASIGGGSTFTDDAFRIQDDGDNTKELAFEISGLTTATTRTITADDRDIDLSANATFAEAAHASRHETGGADEVDGDKLDIDWNPSNYTPSTSPTEADSVDNLTAHLYGIDQAIAGKASTSHAASHERGGSDEIDGDHLGIDWNPSNYTPDTTPTEAANVDDLTAHLYGIDQAIGGKASTTHASNHLTGGSDEIDGDKIDIDWTPSNYTPSTTPTEVDNVDNLTAHLYGIDQELASAGGDIIAAQVETEETINGAETLDSTDDGVMHFIEDSGTPADYTVTLRAAGTAGAKVAFYVDPNMTKTPTIDGNASETIGPDGDTSLDLSAGDFLLIEDDGSNWRVLVHQSYAQGWHVTRGTAQTITTGTDTKMEFTSETYDVGGIFDNSTNYRGTPTKPGKYWFYSMVRVNGISGADKFVQLTLRKNGSPEVRGPVTYSVGSGVGTYVIVSGTVILDGKTDYVEVYIKHESGSNEDTDPDGTNVFFQCWRVSDK